MSRFKRRLLLGLGLGAAALLVAGLWFYYVYFRSMDAVLRHAEGFRFRRMTVPQLAEGGSYRFHWITNRLPTDTDSAPELRFGTQPGDRLSFGSFDTRIEPSLGLGMLLNPSDWFQNEEIQLEAVRELEREAFVEEVRRLVQQSPRGSLLVVVHGFRETFPTALRKTAFVSHVLDIDTPVLVFDWPGDQGSSLRGYRRAHEVARASGVDLAAALGLVLREIEPARLWLLANSMGAQVVADAFGVLVQDPELADASTEIEDVVLTAPDVAHDEFDERFKDEIAALTRNLTVYVSSNDRALLASRIVNRGRRRGESTLSPDQLEEATRVAELIEPDSERVTLVDVTPINRTRNFHNFSLETPEFFDDLFLRLVNDRMPDTRLQYRVRTPEGSVYWVLTRGR